MKIAASQFLRAMRGSRSQIAFARRLGYRANPITDWERGRRYPTAKEAFRAAKLVKIDVTSAFAFFHPATPPGIESAADNLSAWLRELAGSIPVGELAKRGGFSRFSVSRWLSGQAQPRLPEFFRLVDAITGRLPDLVAKLVDIELVPALKERQEMTEASKKIAFEDPWTEAVLRVMETSDYQRLTQHVPGWIAQRLGIEPQQESRCLALLEVAHVIRKYDNRFVDIGYQTVDTGMDPKATQALKQHWTNVAAERIAHPVEGDVFAYNILSISRPDLERIRKLLRSTYREIRSIVAASDPADTVALVNLQLVVWNAEAVSFTVPRGKDTGHRH